MAEPIPKVQQQAIAEIQGGSLSRSEYEDLLQQAAEKGWRAVLETAIQSGGDQPLRINSLLYEASKFGRDHADTVKLLLASGADPNSGSVMDYCGIESLPLLIDAGGDVNGRNGRPLMKAITERAKQDKALALIAAGANPNACDARGITATMHAAARGRIKVYDALVAAGADLYAVDKTGRSLARQIAESVASQRFHAMITAKSNATRIARDLREMLPAQPEDQVLLAIVVGDAQALSEMLEGGLDPNTMIEGGLGLTGVTFEESIAQMMKPPQPGERVRLTQSTEEEDAAMEGTSLLMWATATMQADCIRTLLDRGADPSLKNKGGLSALKISEKHVRFQVIQQLLLGGIEVKDAADSASINTTRCQILGLPRAEVEKELLSALEFLEGKRTRPSPRRATQGTGAHEARLKQAALPRVKINILPSQKRDTPPENRGYDIARRWEIAQLHYVLEESKHCNRALINITELAHELFFGAHHQQPYRDCNKPLPHTAQWKAATKKWSECFPVALAACAATNNWELADRLLTYSDEACERGEKSPKYNLEYYEWPLWMHMGAIARGEVPKAKWLEDMKQQSTRRSKAVLVAYQAITEGKQKQAQKAIDRIVQSHIADEKKRCKAVFASRCVSAEATFLFYFALRNGLALEFQEGWDPYLMQRAAN